MGAACAYGVNVYFAFPLIFFGERTRICCSCVVQPCKDFVCNSHLPHPFHIVQVGIYAQKVFHHAHAQVNLQLEIYLLQVDS